MRLTSLEIGEPWNGKPNGGPARWRQTLATNKTTTSKTTLWLWSSVLPLVLLTFLRERVSRGPEEGGGGAWLGLSLSLRANYFWVGGERVRLWAWAVMAGRWGRFDEEDTFFRRCFPRVLLSCSAERTSASGKLLSCHHLLLTYEAWTRINRPVVLEERSSVPSPLLLTSAVRLFQIRLLTLTRETELIFSFLSQKRATGFWSTAITVWE